jgi:gas vesicle protein
MSRGYDRGCDSASGVLGFITGLALGGVLAVLFAPRTGRETREDLSRCMAQANVDVHAAVDAARATATRRVTELRREAGLE